ncbi:MAG: hypothetical protein RIB60_10145 [Phycisphaerales bacterium]
MKHTIRAALFGGAIWCAGQAPAGDTYTIFGPSSTAAGSNYYNWDSYNATNYLNDLRNALHGTYHFANAFATFDAKTRAYSFDYLGCCNVIQRADCIISPWWDESYQTAYEVYVASYHFLANGKDLLLFNDDSGHDGIAAYLGVPTFSSGAGSTWTGSGFPFDGPFGNAAGVTAYGTIGYLDASDVLSTGGQILATDSSGRPTIAFWDDDEYAPGAGRMLIVTDVNTVTSGFGNAQFFPPNNQGRFALNLIAGLIGGEGCNKADCDQNGILNFDDIDCFVDGFLGGCP